MTNSRHAVLVTGASSGLGEAMALGLAGAGCTVYAGVRSEENAQRLAATSPQIHPVILDVAEAGSIATAGKLLREQTGAEGLHGLVNNAGTCVSAPLECLPIEDLRAELEVNLVGMVALTQELLPLLRMRAAAVPRVIPSGRIVNISSGIGRVARRSSAPTPRRSSPRRVSPTRCAANSRRSRSVSRLSNQAPS